MHCKIQNNLLENKCTKGRPQTKPRMGNQLLGVPTRLEMGVKRMFLIENDASYTHSAWTLLRAYVLKPLLTETASYYADMPLNI